MCVFKHKHHNIDNMFNIHISNLSDSSGSVLKNLLKSHAVLSAQSARTMKLFTHNMLTSQMIKSVQVGYPLKLTASEVRVLEQDFQPTFLIKMLPKVNWSVLYDAVQSIGHGESTGLPPTINEESAKSEEFLKKAHHALFEIEVINGEMECPESGRKFPIQNGVPNMLINEDEC